jgi:CheY-like chemotaxis protein
MSATALPRRILVVDDDDYLREVLTSGLAEDGYRVDGARDGNEALSMLERHAYDLVLSDLQMPRLDGPTLYETLGLRRSPGAPASPKLPRVIFMTGNPTAHTGFLRGTTDPILEKPFTLRVVRKMVQVMLADAPP